MQGRSPEEQLAGLGACPVHGPAELALGPPLASRLAGRSVFRVDLSTVTSKYIGETEKNLRQLFEAASVCGAVLMFDEADDLFGKRSEVKDAHDRDANIEVAYLVEMAEERRGVAILATNRKANIDPAFMRRIWFIVEFPHPGPQVSEPSETL